MIDIKKIAEYRLYSIEQVKKLFNKISKEKGLDEGDKYALYMFCAQFHLCSIAFSIDPENPHAIVDEIFANTKKFFDGKENDKNKH